jgi:hypothetical protein
MSSQQPLAGPTVVLHELAALFERLPNHRRTEASRVFLKACRRLDAAELDPFTTVQIGAQITVEAFSKFGQ